MSELIEYAAGAIEKTEHNFLLLTSLPVSHYFNLISIQKKVLRHLRIVGAIRILVGELNKNVLHEARLEEPRRSEDDLGITTLNIDFHERNLN